ncbi:gliding motility-associated C-terminal domain-containing protein [Negadavirga shengliensis]|uniref:Gliding motility-associated C-terminal domain-containing protein n=1 Tax=Negadavirga shengliensis TaxID=1389218 RepID=A0ABV9T1Y2_9BACT
MKYSPINIIIRVTFAAIFLLGNEKVLSQGYNNNEWIFGYCGSSENNNYISFGKGGEPAVQSLPGSIIVGEDNNAIAIDPITGQILFYTNGELVYNYDNQPIQGAPNGFNGNYEGRQTVAISSLSYDPDGERLFYAFYISPSGQLQYSVIDMDAPGGANSNQPPLGEVTTLDEPIGPASGAIAVVKTSESPSYLISFEDGELVARRIEEAEGSFLVTDSESFSSIPKAIIFNEDTRQLVIIPENPNEELVVLDFDTSTGTFGAPTALSQSGNGEPIEGAAFSPDGSYIYFSQGDQLLRIPVDDPNASPEAVPLESDIDQIYDIRAGPDGRLYYIYQEPDNDAYYVGRVNNPDEESLEEVEPEEDPFNGTDFCGTVFPTFSPNMDIDAQVDFIWQDDFPCMNNPLQLTSIIEPTNYRPVSFEWEILPPPVDEDGEEIEMDMTQEHLLLPASVTSEEQVTVILTVTFANGETATAGPKTIEFTENELQAQFTPSDTTLCYPWCNPGLDLNDLLEVSSGDDQGGGGGGGLPGGGVGGQPGGGNYEYFWSNKKDERWISEAPNEVCEPGTYWVLVREPNSTCYSYAEITVRAWDTENNQQVNDQTNQIWYFGNNAGLDFNPDPDDPDAPTPRPVENPGYVWNLPAGTTTISDQTGQVLFYTDGETVWDLNGNQMANGADLGGDNMSAGSVIAVEVPGEPGLYYLFTTQAAAGGSNQANFSVVDMRGQNQDGIGNVVSKGNFLFSPSTEHSAALNTGDTTWVMYHEVGNNSFRAYPVSGQGIGQPVISSVGSVHNFGTGVGTMKFSPQGDKLTVTIVENGCSYVEVFDFDQNSGELTNGMKIDLGCDDEVYGVEFSSDGTRLFVSYLNEKGVEEFFIRGVEETDATDPENPITTVCPECFENASSQSEIEQCILDSRATVSGSNGLNLGALQMGPDGQIYAAVVGSDRIGQIQIGSSCNPSTFSQDGVLPMPGPSGLGLPSFVQQSGSYIADPMLSGPERLCLSADEGAVGLFEGGGEPDIDSYFWTITHEDGTVVYDDGGPGEEFQDLEYVFDAVGVYTVELNVDRCGTPWEEVFTMEVEVLDSPEIILPSEITLCAGATLELVAVDPEDPSIDEYVFEWVNAAGEIVGNENVLEVTEESIYTVTVAYALPDGQDPATFETCPVTQSVFVGPAFEFEITQSDEEVCYGETVTFSPDTPVTGVWSIQLEGSDERLSLGESQELELNTGDLEGPGDYEVYFLTEDPLDSTCAVEKTVALRVNPLPDFEIISVSPAESCEVGDGMIEIRLLADLDSLISRDTEDVFLGLTAGETLALSGLGPGTYTFEGYNGGCFDSQVSVVENSNPPADVGFEVEAFPETCGVDGFTDGAIVIRFPNGPASGSYTIIGLDSGEEITDSFTEETEIETALPRGRYMVEVTDIGGCAIPDPQTYEISGGDEVEVELSSPQLCGGAETTEITALGDLTEVDRMEWYRVVGAARTLIEGETGPIITVDAPGRYEIVLYNEVDCVIGSGEIDINESASEPPQLQDQYEICALEGNVTTLDPGTWATYEWFLDGELVSEEREFTPEEDGEYELRVMDEAGCEFSVTFSVQNVCEVDITFPNAVIPDNPSKNFVIHIKGQIDEIHVYIYNRWGELIYYCEEQNPVENISICSWDGMVNGRKVLPGTYPVVVKFTNERQMINKTLRKAIVVID